MTNAKVVVTKEVAEAIEELYIEYGGKTPDRVEVITYDIIRVTSMRKEFGGMRLQDVIKAISEGYEVERSPEDKVREYYARNGNEYASTPYTTNLFEGRRQGIVETLDLLGIKIEGVNA